MSSFNFIFCGVRKHTVPSCYLQLPSPIFGSAPSDMYGFKRPGSGHGGPFPCLWQWVFHLPPLCQESVKAPEYKQGPKPHRFGWERLEAAPLWRRGWLHFHLEMLRELNPVLGSSLLSLGTGNVPSRSQSRAGASLEFVRSIPAALPQRRRRFPCGMGTGWDETRDDGKGGLWPSRHWCLRAGCWQDAGCAKGCFAA